MVTQINPKGSVAVEATVAPLSAHKPAVAPQGLGSVQGAPSKTPGLDQSGDGTSAKEVETAVKAVRNHLSQSGSELEINYDKDTGRNVVKIVDPSTGGVVVQFPPEEVLAMARKLRETDQALGISGVLVDREG